MFKLIREYEIRVFKIQISHPSVLHSRWTTLWEGNRAPDFLIFTP
jgi:hypothetical protein